MDLTEQNKISVAELCFYFPSLFIAIWLCIRHGFGRSSGWFYMIIFSLARIIGPSMQLATISQPTNISLYIGAATLSSIGLSPLILVELGLLSRALTSIRKSVQTFVNERVLRLIQIVIMVGLILGIVGGTQAGNDFASTGKYTPNSISKAGIILMIVGFILTILLAVQVGLQVSHAEPGEKRIVLAVAFSLPFVLVRLAYSAIATLGDNKDFNQLSGNINIQLGMSVIMEMFAVVIFEGTGLTLQKETVQYKNVQQNQHQYEMGPNQESGRQSY